MELITILLFCAVLVVCLLLKVEVLYALCIGLLIFCGYALKRGFTLGDVVGMCIDGVKTASNVLLTFLLIGVLTAFWRMAGTIPVIVCYAGALIRPSLFLLMTFLLNSLVSALTGTSFGTAATMGVICATMGQAMHIPAVLIGGSVLSGAFFGDRCSPVSTSALLVAELTNTSIFDNIRGMVKTAVVPFILSCVIFGIVGRLIPYEQTSMDLSAVFGQAFRLHWTALIPAVLIMLLSAFRFPVKKAMLLSILSAIPVCLLLQGQTVWDLVRCVLLGYSAENPEVGAMMNGGGVLAMLRVTAIVCLSSAYSGIFRKTGLLGGVQSGILAMSRRISPFGATIVTAVLTAAVGCNQTLSIILTKQLCEDIVPDNRALAIDLENTAVVIAPLIPWAIAGAVPLASVNAPTASLWFAVYLYLLPIWNLLVQLRGRRAAKAA